MDRLGGESGFVDLIGGPCAGPTHFGPPAEGLPQLLILPLNDALQPRERGQRCVAAAVYEKRTDEDGKIKFFFVEVKRGDPEDLGIT